MSVRLCIHHWKILILGIFVDLISNKDGIKEISKSARCLETNVFRNRNRHVPNYHIAFCSLLVSETGK